MMELRVNVGRLRRIISGGVTAIVIANVFAGWISWGEFQKIVEDAVLPYEARAVAQYTATGGNLVTGTNTTIVSNAASGNTGSYRGTLASDNFRWIITATTSGFDQQLQFDGSQLNGANKFIVVMEAAASNTTLQRVYQICDWTSSTNVDNAADAQCTTGGWRTMNIRDAVLTSATETAYTWHIYDGYWNQSGSVNSPLSTPLSNFIRSSDGRILLRGYAPTNCNTCTHTFDYARVDTVIDPIYTPAGATNLGIGTATNNYTNATNALFTGQSASDNQYVQFAGTSTTTADFYLSFQNVRTYPGANKLLMRSETSCTATGINYRYKIYNFTDTAWENITAAIACATGDTTHTVSVDTANAIDEYISSGEVRLGLVGQSNAATGIRVDMMYLTVGSVNDDSAQCEISFGTGTATNCTNTRNMDSTITPVTWQQTSEAESATFGHAYYGQDNDADANIDHASSANLWIPVSITNPARVTALAYAMNWRSNATTMTTQGQFKDNSGQNATISGGWTAFGTTNALTTYTYQDAVTNGYFVSNPDDYINPETGDVNVRIRTTVSTAAAGVTRDIDFVMATVQWVETTPSRYTLKTSNVPTGSALPNGTNNTIVSNAASGNVGSYYGALASDNFTWGVTATTSGLDQQFQFTTTPINGANKFIVVFEVAASATTLQRLYQICDWVSSTDVDTAAGSNCTGGGWRTMNVRDTAITATADTSYTWHIYDGYWNQSGSVNSPLSTPLSNFISTSTGQVLIRAYSTTNCNTCTHLVDRVHLTPVVDPIYTPSGATNLGIGAVTGDYRNATNALFTGQSASDNNRYEAAGTSTTTADFYLSFKNVETYSQMNSIVMRAEYSCSVASNTHRPKIWNFTNSSWEDLSTTSIGCSTTDATNAFAISNIDVNDYISSGEVRIGWRTLASGTQAVRIDMIYIMLGSVNTDSAQCEISFGTGTATNCVNTRTLDTTLGSPSTWQQTSEAESATFGHDYYALDNDADANIDHASSANLWIPTTIPTNAMLYGRVYALNWRSNATTMTAQTQYRDFSGQNATVSGGWTLVGPTNALTTYTYADAVTNGYFQSNPDDYVDTYNGRVNMRLRTSVSTAAAGVTRDWDFAFTSVQWLEPPGATPAITLTFATGTVPLGNLTPGTPIFATTTATVEATSLASGYVLQANRASSTATMTHTDATTTIPDYTAWNGSNNSTSSPGLTLSFRLSTSTANFNSTWWGSGTPLFAGFPTTATTIMNCGSCTDGFTTSSVSYRLDVPGTQKTGSYSGDVTYTALSNP